MREVLCSTGALIGRPNGRDYRLLEPLSKKLCFDGFEFMMYSTWYECVGELLAFLNNLKLNIPVMHCEKQVGKIISIGIEDDFGEAYRRFEINCQIASALGAKKLVMHLWDGIPSDQKFDNNLKAYPVFREIAERYRVDLLIENVVCNHADPMTHWLELDRAYDGVHFVFDTKMAAFHDQLELIYEPEYSKFIGNNQIRHLHINDYAGGYKDWENLKTLPIGSGNIDFERFFELLKSLGYNQTFTVESTAFNAEGEVDVDMLNLQYEFINKAF